MHMMVYDVKFNANNGMNIMSTLMCRIVYNVKFNAYLMIYDVKFIVYDVNFNG